MLESDTLTVTINGTDHGEPPPSRHVSLRHALQEPSSSRPAEQLPPPSASPPSLPRWSDMSDISDGGGMEVEVEPDLEQSPSWSNGWSGELTLFEPWRSHTLKGLSKDCISHWTESNEAEFRDGMYHSGFKWRVFMMSSLAFSVLLIVLVDPCLTLFGALTLPFQLLLLSSQITAQRMVDRRRGRQLGQKSLILICIGFGCALVPLALYGAKAVALTWNGASHCTFDAAAASLRRDPMSALNLFVGPCFFFIGVMVTFMTISTKCFVAMVTGCMIPSFTSYLLRDNRLI